MQPIASGCGAGVSPAPRMWKLQAADEAADRRGYDEDCLPQDGLADLKPLLVAGHFAAAADEFGRKHAKQANNEPRRSEPPHASWIPAGAGMTRTQT